MLDQGSTKADTITVHTLTTNGNSYVLLPTENLSRVKARLARAVRAGGRFVKISSVGGLVWILVTAHSHTAISRSQNAKPVVAPDPPPGQWSEEDWSEEDWPEADWPEADQREAP